MRRSSGAALGFALAVLFVGSPGARSLAAGPSAHPEPAAEQLLSVEAVLTAYNAGIRDALAAVGSLSVHQEMIEPLDEGGENRAVAVLTYTRERGMKRDELESTIGHPKGEYTLESLLGPELAPLEYAASVEGVEEKDGRRCYRVGVRALERDLRHFDGSVWVTVDGLNLVRITGTVADPPFPVARVGLDKAFEPGPHGLWLLRRHTGEVHVHFGFIKRSGMVHIFYDDYAVSVSEDDPTE
jgi:hypothetical protein